MMTTLQIPTPLAEKIEHEARTDGMAIADLLEHALKLYRLETQRQKIGAEADWWDGVSEDVRNRYRGEFVAIHRKTVVDHDRDRVALYDRVRKRYGNLAVLIAPATGTPTLRILSPRLETL